MSHHFFTRNQAGTAELSIPSETPIPVLSEEMGTELITLLVPEQQREEAAHELQALGLPQQVGPEDEQARDVQATVLEWARELVAMSENTRAHHETRMAELAINETQQALHRRTGRAN